METRRWTNPSLPASLVGGIWLLYLGAALGVVSAVIGRSFLELFGAVLLLVAAYLIANARTLGWILGVIIVVCQVALVLLALVTDFADTFGARLVPALAFPVLTFASLIHPESRDYQRSWFT